MRRLAPALLLVACGAPPAPAPRADPPPGAPNVVVVLCDTLRADALGAHGARRPDVSPNVDAFAAESLVFDLAITPNAWTVPAVASIFTSTWPQTHGVLRFREFERVELETLAPSFVTVAEVFRANGWETAALLKTGVITASHGFDQGFDTFERLGGDIASGWSGAQLTTAAGAWLDARTQPERPYFLYLHYMDPHTPYQAPPPSPAWARSSESRLTGAHRELAALERGTRVASEADKAHLRGLYDAEVLAFDRAFGDLLARLEAQDDGRGTVIVLVADHGEQLGEHGGWLHSDLWPENVHVPWMIRGPGVAAGRVEGVVSTIDLAPTLAEVAGLAAGPGWQGVARRAGGVGGDRPVFTEYAEQRAVWMDGRALIVGGPAGAATLWDYPGDPGFEREIGGREPGRVEALRAVLDGHQAAARAAGVAVRGRGGWKGDRGLEEGLRGLGYVE